PMKAIDNSRHKLQTIASDFIGGNVSNLGSKISQSWESIKGASGKQKAFLGAGLAVAGIAGYNILSTEKPEMHYNNEPTPAIDTGTADYSATQNATVSVQAQGRNISQDQLSHAVSQGMSE